MTNKLCRADCIYAIDGHCRLENRSGNHGTACTLYEGYLMLAPQRAKEWSGV